LKEIRIGHHPEPEYPELEPEEEGGTYDELPVPEEELLEPGSTPLDPDDELLELEDEPPVPDEEPLEPEDELLEPDEEPLDPLDPDELDDELLELEDEHSLSPSMGLVSVDIMFLLYLRVGKIWC